MVVDDGERVNDDTHEKGRVKGMLTSRDLLRQYGKDRPEEVREREGGHADGTHPRLATNTFAMNTFATNTFATNLFVPP